MFQTRTGNFPVGIRQGWTEWFKVNHGFPQWALANGFSVVDLGGDGRETIGEVAAAGLGIGSVDLLNWSALISADSAERNAAVEANKAHIEACAPHGGRNFFAVMLPRNPHAPRAENFGYMLDSLRALAPTLETNQSRIVIEGWPGEGALCCTPEGYRECLKETSPAIGINFDPSHLLRMGIDPHRFLAEFAPRVYHVHGKDCTVDREALYNLGHEQPATFAKSHGFGTAVWRYTIPGHGESNWSLLLQILVEHGYQGAISIELEDENFNGSTEGEQRGLLASAHFLASA